MYSFEISYYPNAIKRRCAICDLVLFAEGKLPLLNGFLNEHVKLDHLKDVIPLAMGPKWGMLPSI
jgi:hypothetical protein